MKAINTVFMKQITEAKPGKSFIKAEAEEYGKCLTL